MKNFDMSAIMKAAWSLYKKGVPSFAMALRTAWANAKAANMAKANAAVCEETHSWYGWRELGFNVIHGSVALYKTVIVDPFTKSGTRTKAYFGASQVEPIVA